MNGAPTGISQGQGFTNDLNGVEQKEVLQEDGAEYQLVSRAIGYFGLKNQLSFENTGSSKIKKVDGNRSLDLEDDTGLNFLYSGSNYDKHILGLVLDE